MGFATGFTGGVTLTMSVAYLTMLAHRRNRETQSEILRVQTNQIRSILDPPPPPLPPRRSEVAAAQRDHMVEVAKDRWNAEVLNAARWVQGTDWAGVRENMEDRVGYLWRQVSGGQEPAIRERDGRQARPLAERARAGAAHAGDRLSEATRGTVRKAREKAEQAELSAENAALDARLRTRRALGEKTAEVQDVVAEVVEKGEEMAKTAVRLAETQVMEMLGNEDRGKKKSNNTKNRSKSGERRGLSPVEKALAERFGKTRDIRSVQEVLRERYVPIDQRDNTQLRGL